jgi:PEP-CTERM motif
MLAAAPTMADTLYSNGPYNGTTDAWAINFGFSVSDSFMVPGDSRIEDFHHVYWDASSTDLLTTLDLQIGSSSFSGATHTLTGVTNQFLGTNQFGYFLYAAGYTFTGIPWSGAGYVTLSNACSTSGCSVSNSIYWDENGGRSTAYENTLGSIPSEAFTLTAQVCRGIAGGRGPDCGQTPEPSTITLLFGSGIVALAGGLRRWLF